LNELHFLCCDICYLLELTLKTQVSNTINAVGISSNDKYLLRLLLLLQLMFKVPSTSMHTDKNATDSLPHRWCCAPSHTSPLSVTSSSGWYHVNMHVLIGDGNFRPSFYKKQYLSHGQASCHEISQKHCK